MDKEKSKAVALIVAHPDDETLWAGGTILNHPEWNCFVVCLCRKNDPERAPKFFKALERLNCSGIMGDLDDGPLQVPLDDKDVESVILDLLPSKPYDMIMTHNLSGEYTRHLRHEEVSKAVIRLWASGRLKCEELRTFAYEDGSKAYFPIAIENSNIYLPLNQEVWDKKYSIMTQTYGFEIDSWESRTTPHTEAFWEFKNHHKAKEWLTRFDKNPSNFNPLNI